MAAEILTVTIERLANGGAGLGFHAGRAVFVPFTAPGDTARVAVKQQGKNHMTADLVELIAPGPGRVTPVCPLHGHCGGCDLQHVGDAGEVKTTLVREALSHIGRLPEAAGRVLPLLPAPSPTGYRRRAGFKVRWVGGRALVGFFQHASHKVVELQECPVLHPGLAGLLEPLRRLIPTLGCRERLPQVDAVAGENGVGVTLHLITPLSRADRQQLMSWASELDLAELWTQQGRKETLLPLLQARALHYTVDGMDLRFHTGDFIQANLEQNERLVATAMDLAGSGENALELFCGVGNFTLPLARRFQRVAAWEGYGPAIVRARENAQRHGLGGVTFHEGNLMDGWAPPDARAETLLLDPPREGAVAAVKAMASGHHADRIVYVSCDPVTLARDLAILVHGGYGVESIQPIDMFPMTHHVEVVAGLKLG